MKHMTRLLAVLLALVLTAGLLTACHPKNETAVTIGDIKISSAVYICALIDADMDARETVYDKLSKEEGFDASAEIDYAAQTIEDKPFEEYVRAAAIDKLRTYAGIRMKFAELGLSLTDDEKASAENYAQYYWNNYGAAALYGENGVSYESYRDYSMTSAMMSSYFLSLYGKEGTEPVAEEEVNKAITDNYDLVYAIQSKATDDAGAAKDEEQLAADKTTFEGYAARINDGSATFAVIEKEFNGTEDTTEVTENTETAENTEETEPNDNAPLDEKAILIGSEETGNTAFSQFSDVHAAEIGKAIVLEQTDGTSLLIQRLDVSADPYYMKNYYNSALSLLKYDGFEASLKEFSDGLTVTENSFAINNFKLDKLDYTTYYSFVQQVNGQTNG